MILNKEDNTEWFTNQAAVIMSNTSGLSLCMAQSKPGTAQQKLA